MAEPKDLQECESAAMEFYKPLPQQYELSGEEVKGDFFKNAVQEYNGNGQQESK